MNFLTGVTGALLIIFFGATMGIARADEAADIRALIGETFDRPEARVVSDPIVIEQGYALADWVQGEKGGRALLRMKDGVWTIMLCAGDGIRQAGSIAKAGVPYPIADALASKLSRIENSLPPERVKMFGLFKVGEEPAQQHHGGHH